MKLSEKFIQKRLSDSGPQEEAIVSIKRSGNYNLISSSDGLLLATPTYRSRVTLGDRSFQVAAPALWNVLPREIRSITDLGIFKRHLKTYLFREAFY